MLQRPCKHSQGHERSLTRCMQCAELSAKLAEDLASEGLQGKAIMLKLKETSFELRTRNKMLPNHISSGGDIFREAMKLLKPELPIKIRLMVKTSAFISEACALHGCTDTSV